MMSAASLMIWKQRHWWFFRRFGFGDRTWRSSTSMATQADGTQTSSSTREQLPLLMVSSCSSASSPESRCLYRLTKDEWYHTTSLEQCRELTLLGISKYDYYLAGSSQGFLFFWPRSGGHIRAIHPLTGAHFLLPPVAVADFLRETRWHVYDPNKMKIVLSPSLDMAVLLRETFRHQAVFTRLPSSSSSSSSEWTPFPLPSSFTMADDCIFHKNRLYLVKPFDTIIAFDEHDFTHHSPSTDLLPSAIWHLDESLIPLHTLRARFVESPDGNNIFLLFRCASHMHSIRFGTMRWLVYKLDDDGKGWEPVKSIGDLAFFVGQCNAMSLPVHRNGSSVLEPDSIYFTDEFDDSGCPPEGLVDTGLYNLEDRTVRFFPVPDSVTMVKYSPPVWHPPAACC